MVCKNTSTNRRRRAGMLLPEAMMAIGVTGIVVLVVVNFMVFSGRSFAALFNYVDLNDDNRIAIDTITSDVRQANRVKSATSNTLVLEDYDLSEIIYTYGVNSRTLTRSKNGANKVILHDCDFLSFSLGQRNALYGSYDVYPAATPATCKVVNVSWVCSRTIFGNKDNSESVQTARIVIRKQGS